MAEMSTFMDAHCTVIFHKKDGTTLIAGNGDNVPTLEKLYDRALCAVLEKVDELKNGQK